jgi:hypothetical protein
MNYSTDWTWVARPFLGTSFAYLARPKMAAVAFSVPAVDYTRAVY